MPKTTLRRRTKKISSRNTKQEIWDAYEELKLKIEEKADQGDPSFAELDQKKISEILSKSKTSLNQSFDEILEGFVRDLENLEQIRDKASKEQQKFLEEKEKEKKNLQEELEKAKEKIKKEKEILTSLIEEERKKKELIHRREEEEYQYQLRKARRTEKDDYQEKRAQIERSLEERENRMKEREEEIAQMEEELEKWPERQEKEESRAKKELAEELRIEHEAEIREIKMMQENEKEIKNLKISNLEEIIKRQVEEINSLKDQLSKASDQLKDIAVSVIESGGQKKKKEKSPVAIVGEN